MPLPRARRRTLQGESDLHIEDGPVSGEFVMALGDLGLGLLDSLLLAFVWLAGGRERFAGAIDFIRFEERSPPSMSK